MRCVASLSLTLPLFLTLTTTACGDDSSSDESGAAASSGTGGSTGDATGTADETGTGGEPMGPWNNLEERPCPDDNFLTYENFGGPFMLTYCTGCHGSGVPADMRQMAPLGVDFDDVEDVRTHAVNIWALAADQNEAMPPVGAADDMERMMLGEWLACGAPTDADIEM
ncbi:MAG: hypothetical protein K0V04_40375 [Deltaproteobacteria bacterium]|nr:hypothetical protein [Deltaproteobacteria bacterium]